MNVKEFIDIYNKYKNGTQLTTDESSMLQQFLVDKGYDIGPSGVDGNIGNNTKKALSEYESSGDLNTDIETYYSSADPMAKQGGKYLNPMAVLDAVETGEVEWSDVDRSAFDEDWLLSNNISPTEFKTGELGDGFANIQAAHGDMLADYRTRVEAGEKLQADRDYARADIYNITKGAVDVTKAVEAASQIAQGRETREELEANRPDAPLQARGEELREATQEAGARAQRGLSQQSLGALGARDMAAFANAMRAAQTFSGGQASVGGSLASKAYRDALDRNLSTVLQNEAANQANFQQYAQLAGARANELADINRVNQRNHEMDRQEYNRALGEAAALERTGRVNRANLLATLPTTAANITRQYYKVGQQRGNKPLEGTPEAVAFDANREAFRLAKKQKMQSDLDNMINAPLKEDLQGIYQDSTMDEMNRTAYNPYFGGVENFNV